MNWLEPTTLLLLACGLLYGLMGEWVDGAILLAFVLGIGLLDAVQQQRSSHALAELARLSAPRAHVRRDGQELELPTDQVRLGDQLRLEEGDRVAADAALTEAVGLWLDESLLTGESLPVARTEPGERVLAGSLVAGGRGWATVVAVAEATELGRLGKSLATVQPPLTRLQRQTRRLTSRLTVMALALCAALAVIQGASSGDWPRALLAALALAQAGTQLPGGPVGHQFIDAELPLLRAHAPRAMLDLNRAESDIDWEMIEGPRLSRPVAAPGANHRARSGLGLIPRRLPGHGEIWRTRLPRAELDRRIADVHQPYHRALAEELQRIRDLWGAALLIDLHSMPPLTQRDSPTPAPVMVLGDRFGASCHHALVSRGLSFFESEGVPAAQNRPYSGGYVLDRHGAPESGIHALQIEVCRSLYLDDGFAELTPAAAGVAALLARLVYALGQETAALGQARSMLEAAE